MFVVAGHFPNDVDPDPALRGMLVDELATLVVIWSVIFTTTQPM